MPKKKPQNYMTLDLSHLSKAVKAMKPAVQTVSPIMPSGSNASETNTIQLSEGGSGMEAKTKVKKDPLVSAEEKIAKAIAKAIENAESQLNRKLVSHILTERVRQAINAKFHGRVSPADIDRFSKDAARGVAHELGDLKVIPEAFYNNLMVDLQNKDDKTYTDEPDGDHDIDD